MCPSDNVPHGRACLSPGRDVAQLCPTFGSKEHKTTVVSQEQVGWSSLKDRVLGTVLRAVPRGMGSLGSGNVCSPMACWAMCPVHWEKSHSLVTGVDRLACNLPSEDLQR